MDTNNNLNMNNENFKINICAQCKDVLDVLNGEYCEKCHCILMPILHCKRQKKR
jgi:hypothetical protein